MGQGCCLLIPNLYVKEAIVVIFYKLHFLIRKKISKMIIYAQFVKDNKIHSRNFTSKNQWYIFPMAQRRFSAINKNCKRSAFKTENNYRFRRIKTLKSRTSCNLLVPFCFFKIWIQEIETKQILSSVSLKRIRSHLISNDPYTPTDLLTKFAF